jgi:hypothetical protein
VNVNSKHPPNQKKTNHCYQDVADPLARRLRIAKIKHAAIVASGVEQRDSAIGSSRVIANPSLPFGTQHPKDMGTPVRDK